jgi:hypothetical protein
MASEDANNSLALDRVRSWKDAGATLLLSFTASRREPFTISVSVLGVDDSSMSFRWLLFAVDPEGPTPPFVSSDGVYVVWLEGASFSLTDEPKKSVAISRGPFCCILTETRASAFGP